MIIPLSEIFPLAVPNKFKVHLASWNGHFQPLDVFVRDRSEWKKWNTWRYHRDDFNREFIFALMDYYPEPGIWLFGGVYRVLSRSKENLAHSYTVELCELGSAFIGRLKLKFKRPGRARVVKLENYHDQMIVSELLKEPYSGERFCGFENICHDFNVLENIFRMNKQDWKAALENVKGVYLIVDKNNGKSYVGSAYGEYGIWARWQSYMNTGHGWNDELVNVIRKRGMDYARKNFRFSLLEYMPARTDDSTVVRRENYWKEALLTRDEKFGYNKN